MNPQRLNISEFNKIEAWGSSEDYAGILRQVLPESNIFPGSIIFTDADSAAFFSVLDSSRDRYFIC